MGKQLLFIFEKRPEGSCDNNEHKRAAVTSCKNLVYTVEQKFTVFKLERNPCPCDTGAQERDGPSTRAPLFLFLHLQAAAAGREPRGKRQHAI